MVMTEPKAEGEKQNIDIEQVYTMALHDICLSMHQMPMS